MSRTNATLLGSQSRCQCPTCGEFFSTTSNFDKHRKGSHDEGRYCVDPESVGLVIGNVNGNTFWRGKGSGELLGLRR